jgi:mannose-1-phosphate guanylyltransferase/mannose-1-phosphate guanylyltransferase/mannose-6-phosphate isomerase
MDRIKTSLMNDLNRAGFVDGVPTAMFSSVMVSDYIQNLDRFFDARTGAVYEGIRDDGTPPFLFSEVTGYAMRDLLLLHAMTGDASYVNRAEKAAVWLMRKAWHGNGWIRTRYYFERDDNESLNLYSFAGGNIFTFDNGICLNGLVSLWRATAGTEVFEHAKVLADNLVKLVKDDGSVPAIVDIHGNTAQLEQRSWSQQSGSFHTKIAEALVEFAGLAGDERYAEVARQICVFALRFQEDDGRFITDRNGLTQLHPHCYATEGLLRVGRVLGDSRFVEAACRATEWALEQRCGDKLPQVVGVKGPIGHFCRTDTLAQVLGLGARLCQVGCLDDRWWQSLGGLANSLWSMKDPHQGHFRYGVYENGQESLTLSYWTNMFAFHSLLEYLAAWVCKNTSVLVLAGGIGSRCWPISCENMPKPLSRAFLGDRSLLEETVSRFLQIGCVLPDNLFVVSGTNGLEQARSQVQGLQIPARNVIEELTPKGTVSTLRLALEPLTSRMQDILVVSMGDNIVEPIPMFRDNLIRAAIATWWNEQGVVVSLAVPERSWDPRFGNAIYTTDQEIVPGVYRVNRFIEKPTRPPRLEKNESLAWEGGCVVSTVEYVSEFLEKTAESTDPQENTIAYRILQNQMVRKAVSLYSPTVRFIDFGVLGKDLADFFAGTKADRGNGNVFLGPRDVEVAFCNATQNIVCSDRVSIEVVGIDDCLIVDNSFTNTAVVVPLDKVDVLPKLYRMLDNEADSRPYITGGEIALAADPNVQSFNCYGESRISSSNGLAIAAHCRCIQLERSEERLRVVGDSRMYLTDPR